MKLTRPYLIIFNPFYWLATALRNLFFDIGILKSKYFDMPVIAVGNLSAGGTGKTPHTEYLISFLKDRYKLAVLSRGYRRKSSGFQVANKKPLASRVGDEPAQMKTKFPNVTVAVDADRVNGINQLRNAVNTPQVVLLDDAFQHRKLQAGFYVLLTDYSHLYTNDTLLPAGNLRETKSGAHRANIIVVTKCPSELGRAKKEEITRAINPKSHQSIYFTSISYGKIEGALDIQKEPFVLLTGIANPSSMVKYLELNNASFNHLSFPDHHHFSDEDIEGIIEEAKEKKVNHILTTEKDYQRLPLALFEAEDIAISYLPIKILFLENESEFQQGIEDYISGYDGL